MLPDDYPPPVVMDQQEQRIHLATAAYEIAETWAEGVSERLSTRERVHGAVHDVLHMLERGAPEVPAFHLVPVFNEDQSSMTEVYRGGGPVDAEWDHGVTMTLIPSAEHLPATTDLYQGIYDSHRARFTIAAYELFGKP